LFVLYNLLDAAPGEAIAVCHIWLDRKTAVASVGRNC
jgi:hypothetical protein